MKAVAETEWKITTIEETETSIVGSVPEGLAGIRAMVHCAVTGPSAGGRHHSPSGTGRPAARYGWDAHGVWSKKTGGAPLYPGLRQYHSAVLFLAM